MVLSQRPMVEVPKKQKKSEQFQLISASTKNFLWDKLNFDLEEKCRKLSGMCDLSFHFISIL